MEPPLDPSPIRVVLVDDHQMLRDGLRLRLNQEADLRVVAEAATGKEARQIVAQHKPDLVVLDMGLPDADGIELALDLSEISPHSRLLILSAQGDAELLEQSLRAGVCGYVLKANASEQLLEAIRTVAAGQMYVCQELSSVMLSRFKSMLSDKNAPDKPVLTERETEVLRLVAEGRNTKEIAAQLDLSAKTIETHRLRLMDKLNLHSVAELTKYAIRAGLTSV